MLRLFSGQRRSTPRLSGLIRRRKLNGRKVHGAVGPIVYRSGLVRDQVSWFFDNSFTRRWGRDRFAGVLRR